MGGSERSTPFLPAGMGHSQFREYRETGNCTSPHPTSLRYPHAGAKRVAPFFHTHSHTQAGSPAPLTHSVLKPSRPRNMPLRMDSSWLAVRCSSLTDAAPSKAPSSISDTLLLLKLLHWRMLVFGTPSEAPITLPLHRSPALSSLSLQPPSHPLASERLTFSSDV